MTNSIIKHKSALLMLEDGRTFEGYAIGKEGLCVGEIIFNTSMTGYQEIMTDPSYANQIIAFSYPHIGNVGVNDEDYESNKVWASGIVVHDCNKFPSNYRSQYTLSDFLCQQNIVGISGVDTRNLITHIRDKGSQKACIMSGHIDIKKAMTAIEKFPGIVGADLAMTATTKKVYEWREGTWSHGIGYKQYARTNLKKHVVVYDFGVKRNILRMLVARGCLVTVVPADLSSADVLSLKPDGILLSNGPGDPEACDYAINNITNLLKHEIPIFGICLGHQLLALASGCKIYKMKFGHHGANHPVLDLNTKKVYISSQNHGFAVDKEQLSQDILPTFISLFDNSLQGIQHKTKPFFSIQGHPEASPGPNDLGFLFDKFVEMISKR